ncbi:MAG: hypothetical protein ABIH83_05175 [Candidatus Micrarchaeota archaeon]
MKEDIELLYSANIRLSVDAYKFMLNNKIPEDAMKNILSSTTPFLSLEDVKNAIAQSSKIPMPYASKKAEIIEKGEKVYSHSPKKTEELEKGAEGSMREEKESGMREKAKERSSGEEKKESEISKIKTEIIRASKFNPVAKEHSPKIKINSHADVSGQSRCMGTVDDFISYFRDRYRQEAAILRGRTTNLPILRVDALSKNTGTKARIIAMVADKRITSKGNLWLEVEDEYGRAKVIIPSKEKCFEEAKNILKDDVLAIDGKVNPNFFIANSITWPDIPIIRSEPKCEEDVAIAYLSDLHLGSRYFLENNFKKFLRWIWARKEIPN